MRLFQKLMLNPELWNAPIAEDKTHLIEITHEGISHLDKETQIQLWQNVSRLLLRKLSVCLSRESFDN